MDVTMGTPANETRAEYTEKNTAGNVSNDNNTTYLIVGIALGAVFIIFFVVGFIVIQRRYMQRRKNAPRHTRVPNAENATDPTKPEEGQEL